MAKIVVHSVLVENPDIEEKILKDASMDMIFIPNDDTARFYEEIKDADGLVIADRKITLDHIESMTKCKVIARQGIGYDTIELVKSKEKGIAVCNVPDYCVDEVSDYSLALMLTMLRHVNIYDKHTHDGIWDIQSVHKISKFPPMRRFSEMTLGIFGFGRIAKLVAQKAKPFGFRILATDPYVDKKIADEYGVILTDFDTVVRESDIVSINTPLTPETRHSFNMDVFKRMKPSAYLVNTGRGPLIKEDDLYAALKEGVIAGAAIDVSETEPLPKDSLLFTLENLIVTPHAAFFTQDSFAELRRRACEEAVRVVQGKEAENRVNI